MKKLIIFSLLLACVGGLNAQLVVNKKGNVRIGPKLGPEFNKLYPTPNSPQKLSWGEIATGTPTDTLAIINVLGRKTNGGGGYITFGDRKKVGIGEFASASNADSDILYLFGNKGIRYDLDTLSVMFCAKRFNKVTFNFYADIKADAFLVNSDARLKQNVNSISGLSDQLSKISPVSYNFTGDSPAMKAQKADGSNADISNRMPPSDRQRFGFIAQEVKEIFPELVVEDENGYLCVDYIGFIPILVDAYRNLENRAEEQDRIIASLTNNPEVARKALPGAQSTSIIMDQAELQQNRPNPFRESTTISCTVPKDATSAFICIYDLQGKQIRKDDINERGTCTITIDGSSLQPGMYIYALIVDGQEIDSRKMILTD